MKLNHLCHEKKVSVFSIPDESDPTDPFTTFELQNTTDINFADLAISRLLNCERAGWVA